MSSFFSIISEWYPKSKEKVLKILDKIAPPKIEKHNPEAYLQFPEDESEFPIEVSSHEEAMQNLDDSDSSVGSSSVSEENEVL